MLLGIAGLREKKISGRFNISFLKFNKKKRMKHL